MDSHGRPVCADRHRRTHTDSHGQTQTSCVYWRTPTDVLCVLNRQLTWAKITRTGHGKGQRAESKDQRADMCTDGQPQTSYVLCVLTDTHRQPQTSCVTNLLICVLMDSHGRPVCADGHTRTHTDSHRRPPQMSCVCWRTPTDVLCVLNRQPTWAKITQTVHGKGQRAESKDQRADMCTDGQPRTSCGWTHTDSHRRPVCAGGHPRIQPTWAKITRTVHGKGQRAEASVLSPRTNVLICVLMDSHGHPVCADGHRRTHTDSHGRPVHGHPVCADGQPQTATDVLCVLADTHGCPVCTEQTAHSTGRASVLSPRTNVLICVLMDSHERHVCADGHTWTHTDSHRRLVCADGHTQTSCTAHVGQNHPNSPREGSAC
ncbi:unnamed protein product [Brassica rapa]|uniref:Uncharacterized protein n=1 Tax=Brassica campestris TaxID=3711 RepID=A0A8D9FZ63_BRACM|nr:unnamed protein product [Brassica rapa]